MPATRTYSSEAFNSLPFRDKLELLYGVPARDKLELILCSPDAQRLVRSFAPESLMFTLKEIGLHDGVELLALASGEQVSTLVDLDCWKKDRFDTESLLEWLELIIEGGDRPIGEFLNSVDLELLVLFLKRFIRVHRQEDPEEPAEDAEGPEVFELDEHYRIEFLRWDAKSALVRQLLTGLHERDYSYFVTVMEEVWWGVESELEEASFRVRNARLQDRGFPDYYEALEIYRPLAAQSLARRTSPLGGNESESFVPLEMSLAIPRESRSLLSELLNGRFGAQAGAELRQEMAFLANRLLVAEGVDHGDREAMAAVIRFAHDTVNLALEHLSRRDARRGAEIVEHHYLQHLFRVGWALLLDLRKRAKLVLESLGIAATPAGEVVFLDSPYREALAGFVRPKPKLFRGLTEPGEIGYRALGALADLERAAEVLDDLASLPDVCERLLDQPLTRVARLRPHDADDFRLSAALLTGLANRVLGRAASVQPLAASELGALRAATIDPGTTRLKPEVRSAAVEAAGSRSRYLDLSLRRFEEEFLAVSPDRPVDPRFVSCLMVAGS